MHRPQFTHMFTRSFVTKALVTKEVVPVFLVLGLCVTLSAFFLPAVLGGDAVGGRSFGAYSLEEILFRSDAARGMMR